MTTLDAEFLYRHFGRIWPTHVQAFTEFMIELRRHFDGDLDRMLILAIIGTRTVPPQESNAVTAEEFHAGVQLALRTRPINIQSIAEVSGIPRETVRRKVAAMVEKGWLELKEEGMSTVLTANRKAADDLSPATRATLRYLAAVLQKVGEVQDEISRTADNSGDAPEAG